MADPGSVTLWLRRLCAGEQEAAQELWERFFQKLVEVAGAKLRFLPPAAGDAEDVALSAFASFCRLSAQGRFPKLTDRHDLWTVLVLIAHRKACNLIKHEQQQKRDWRKTRQMTAEHEDRAAVGNNHALLDIVSREPDPAFVAQAVERCQYLLEKLGDDQLRTIAVRKLEGFSNEEIAKCIDCSLATVERRLNLIRGCWWNERDSA